MTSASPDIVTLGCRLNIHESEAMRGLAAGAGENLVIVNSCAVTGEAVRRTRQTVRRLSRERPDARIVVTGCAAQIDTAAFAGMGEVAHVVGNAEKLSPRTWAAIADGTAPRVLAGDIMLARSDPAPPRIAAFEGRARGFVQVQNGCDHRCTFCIIPFGRGPSRSVAPEEVVAQARSLVEAGYAEIVLTGVDLTSYDCGGYSLGKLVRRVLRDIPDLPRLRLSSVDSVEIDADLIRALAEEPRLMPHLHLSLQAGDDMILKRMKRRHRHADAVRLCHELGRLRPDIVFGADIIAGFPTETEAMFARSLDLIEACGIVHLHAFPFSPRPGTPAARMPQVAPQAMAARAARLREQGTRAFRAFLERQLGQTRSVLMERGGIARTEHFAPVRPREAITPGTIAAIVIEASDGKELSGRIAAQAPLTPVRLHPKTAA